MTELIDVTMTATLRPTIIDRTLKSFNENLFYKDKERFRLIINIDPVGENLIASDVLKICKRYFDRNKIIVITPKDPSFPQAVINVWNKVESPWIFHLEDDWILNKKIDIDDMISILNDYPNLACLRLPKFKTPKGKRPIFFKSRYNYNKRGFYVAEDKTRQFGLNPVLIRGIYIQKALTVMDSNKNPEKQFRYANEPMRKLVMHWEYALYANPGQRAIVTDIGRHWIGGKSFRKPLKGQFLKWEKKDC